MATTSESADKGEKLSDIYQKIYDAYESLEDSPNPSNSTEYQKVVSDAIEQGEKAVHMVNQLELFSSNEQIEEVSTTDIRYLLLPGLLGQLTMKLSSNSTDKRFETMQKAQVYLIDYIRLLRQYGVTATELPQVFNSGTSADKSEQSEESTVRSTRAPSNKAGDIDAQQRKRQEKINRYKRRKIVKDELKTLQDLLKQKSNESDDELRRNYSLKLLDVWLLDTLDSLDTLSTELTLLHEMQKLGVGGERREEGRGENGSAQRGCACKHDQKNSAALRPFIITKTEAQKKVYGIGYPSIPTFTVNEFYQQRVDQGIFPDGSDGKPVVLKDPEEESEREREKAEIKREREEDDDEAVQRARQWDEWTDDHRRGWGNTHNKG